MDHIPTPSQLNEFHYFLEALNTPEAIAVIRVAVILLAAGMAVLYIALIHSKRGKTEETPAVTEQKPSEPETAPAAGQLKNPVE